MNRPFLRDLRQAAIDLQNDAGNWVIAGVTTGIPWPTVAQVVEYLGVDFIVRPPDAELSPSVVLNASKHNLTFEQGQDRIRAFGSALAWYFGYGFEVQDWFGGSRPFGTGRFRGGAQQTFLDRDLLVTPPDEQAATALAFFREGLSLNNPFYAFLSFYKAVASIHRAGKARGDWIADALARMKNPYATKRTAQLAKQHNDVGIYFRDQCRHAIAHSEQDDFVNPDRAVDHARIQLDLAVVTELAKMAITEAFGMDPRNPNGDSTQIPGVEAWLGIDALEKIRAKEPVGDLQAPPSPVIAVARRQNEVVAIEGLHLAQCAQRDNGLETWFASDDEQAAIFVFIDVSGRILRADPVNGVQCTLNENSRSSIDRMIRVQQFVACVFGNGQIELWDQNTNQLLGKSESYMPLNMFFDNAAHEREMQRLQALRDASAED